MIRADEARLLTATAKNTLVEEFFDILDKAVKAAATNGETSCIVYFTYSKFNYNFIESMQELLEYKYNYSCIKQTSMDYREGNTVSIELAW